MFSKSHRGLTVPTTLFWPDQKRAVVVFVEKHLESSISRPGGGAIIFRLIGIACKALPPPVAAALVYDSDLLCCFDV
jgi:hypothetical protein